MTYEDLTPEERAEADSNPIVVTKEDEVDAAVNLSARTGRPVVLPSEEAAEAWGGYDRIDPKDRIGPEDVEES